MLIEKDSGISAEAFKVQNYHHQTTFQLAGTEAEIGAMTLDIVIEQPDEDITDIATYEGGWTKVVFGGEDMVLNSDNRVRTVFGSAYLRVNKQEDVNVGVLWTW